MRQKSEWDDTRLRSFLLLGTVWILGVRARYGQNLMVSGFGGYDHGVHRVGGDARTMSIATTLSGSVHGNGEQARKTELT